MPPTTVFLDVDGVIVDAVKLPQEYIRLLGDVLAPALGGEPEDWGRANGIVFPRVWEQLKDSTNDQDELVNRVAIANIQGMAEHLGIAPPDEATCRRLDDDFHIYVRGNGDFFFAESADVIRTLAASYDVHISSGNSSDMIEVMLERLGVSSEVGMKFGADLVDARKGGPDFYPRVFDATSTDPAASVVVDDQPHQLALAAALGAATVLIEAEPSGVAHPVDATISTIADLPAAIAAL
ncbi:MAG TPA: HAD family hydrolase [Dehalococcoidia bacterium]|nr:HAD family hydrolase [Dehalococcoidia bacterium]